MHAFIRGRHNCFSIVERRGPLRVPPTARALHALHALAPWAAKLGKASVIYIAEVVTRLSLDLGKPRRWALADEAGEGSWAELHCGARSLQARCALPKISAKLLGSSEASLEVHPHASCVGRVPRPPARAVWPALGRSPLTVRVLRVTFYNDRTMHESGFTCVGAWVRVMDRCVRRAELCEQCYLFCY